MINWSSLIFNSFWILGLAILLASFSYTHWLAMAERQPLATLLKQRPFQLSFWLSFTLIGLGLIGTSTPIWEIGIWILFTLLSLFNLVRAYQDKPSRSVQKIGDL